MPALDRPGIFRASIPEYELQESKTSEAVAIAMKFEIYQKQEASGEWVDWNYGQHIYGQAWIIKSDGTLNEKAQQAFMNASGWDGQIESILDKSFQPWPVKLDVDYEKYNGKDLLKVKWINHHDDEGGGGMRAMESDKAKSLIAKYSSKFRASASQAKADNATPPPPPPPTQISSDGGEQTSGDDVPF